MSPDLTRLERALGYRFGSRELLQAALTHRSAGRPNNERLEFLGDAVLGLVIAEALYAKRPDAREGSLSRLRASLVKKSTVAELAAELGLGDYLQLGAGELRSGGFRRSSILADALEALFGALYLDGGYDAARGCIRRLFDARLSELPDAAALKDAKTRLQELLQGRGVALPDYHIERVRGQPHAREFTVRCEIPALGLSGTGEGSSRQRAEQAAARRMLAQLGEPGGAKAPASAMPER